MKTIELSGTATMVTGSGNYNSNYFAVDFWSPDFKGNIKAELDRLSALGPNWNSQGALPIDPAIIEAAKLFADRLPENFAPVPSVVPMASGRLQFEWNEGGRGLEIEFETARQIHFLKWAPDEGVEVEGVFAATDLAKAVKLIQWFTGAIMNA